MTWKILFYLIVSYLSSAYILMGGQERAPQLRAKWTLGSTSVRHTADLGSDIWNSALPAEGWPEANIPPLILLRTKSRLYSLSIPHVPSGPEYKQGHQCCKRGFSRSRKPVKDDFHINTTEKLSNSPLLENLGSDLYKTGTPSHELSNCCRC